MVGMGTWCVGEEEAVVTVRVRARRSSTATDVSSLHPTSLLHPTVGCPVYKWVPDVWPFPFPFKAGLFVALSGPLHVVRVHGALCSLPTGAQLWGPW